MTNAESEKNVAQELLFLVLDKIDEPVVLDMEESKAKLKTNRRIDIKLDDENGLWVLEVVTDEQK